MSAHQSSRPPPTVVATRRKEFRISNLSGVVAMHTTLKRRFVTHRLGLFSGLLAANPAIPLLLHLALLAIAIGPLGSSPWHVAE
jgi:hypothetical protein